MRRASLLVVAAVLALGHALPSEQREPRGLVSWLLGYAEETPRKAPVAPRRPPQILPAVLQRRTNQFAAGDPEENYVQQAQPRILANRPKQRRLGDSKAKAQVERERTKFVKKISQGPVIISSYASTKIQGHGNEEPERKNNIVERPQRTKGDKSRKKVNTPKVPKADSESQEELKKDTEEATTTTPATTSTTQKISVSSTSKSTTTTELDRQTTEERVSEETTESPEINEVEDYESQSPYLPTLPEILDENRILVLGQETVRADERSSESSGTYLAGYQQIESNKKIRFPGDDTTETRREDQPGPVNRPTKPDFYPLGKAPLGQGGPVKKQNLRPQIKPVPLPKQVKEPETSSSFFDFLPFWKTAPATPAPAKAAASRTPFPSRRPVPQNRRSGAPTVTKLKQAPKPADYPAGLQAPVLLKVGSSNYPPQEAPSRPLTKDSPLNTARIDNRIYTEGEDPFVVLPAAAPKRRGPPPPRRPSGRPLPPPRPKNPRLSSGPLPMTSQPVIGLPQVPPSRKQSPFIAKRPQLPPRVQGAFGQNKAFLNGPPRKPLAHHNNHHKRPVEQRKPHEWNSANQRKALITKDTPLLPKPSTPKISLKPNGSDKPSSDIATHLSSLLTSFFSTTVSPARPPAALPSLVEDTDFADIVNGYKASDTNQEIPADSINTNSLSKPTSKIDVDYDIDALNAPLPKNQLQTTNVPTLATTTVTPVTTTTTPATTTTPVTTKTTQKTTTIAPTTTARITFTPRTFPTTTFIAPIQEIVDKYRNKVHVAPLDQLDSRVYQTLQKDFEQKRNIFEQFVSDGAVAFTEVDKRFTPNKEVYNSDWSVQAGFRQDPAPTLPSKDLQSRISLETQPNPEVRDSIEDKVLVYRDLTQSTKTVKKAVTQAVSPTSPTKMLSLKAIASPSSGPPVPRSNDQIFPGERNAEGGFRPIAQGQNPLLN